MNEETSLPMPGLERKQQAPDKTTQELLAYARTCPPGRRPSRVCPSIDAYLASRLAKRVHEWIGDDGSGTVEEIEADLREALDRSYGDDDGYVIARALERARHYEPNGDLVDILDSAFHLRDEANRIVTAEWIAHHKITPKLAVGHTFINGFEGEPASITGIDEKRGTYTITRPARGERPGFGRIVEWERVEAAV